MELGIELRLARLASYVVVRFLFGEALLCSLHVFADPVIGDSQCIAADIAWQFEVFGIAFPTTTGEDFLSLNVGKYLVEGLQVLDVKESKYCFVSSSACNGGFGSTS